MNLLTMLKIDTEDNLLIRGSTLNPPSISNLRLQIGGSLHFAEAPDQ